MIYLLFIITLTLSEIPTQNSEIIDIIKSDNESLLFEAINKLNEFGGIIIINTPIINIKGSSLKINGDLKGSIIGLEQQNGEYPRINTRRQIELYGSNKLIQKLIIENSLNKGLYIDGQNNTLDHCIFRYNKNSGVQMSTGTNYLTFNYCYSYRNGGDKFLSNDEGFYLSGANNITFNYCFSWDNLNNGFKYSKISTLPDNKNLTFLHSASWNNGKVDVFTGKYDYDLGKPLDKNLWTIKELINSDENYISNYYNKSFNIDNGTIDNTPANQWVSKINGEQKGGGFYLLQASYEQNRTFTYSVAFDNKLTGFGANFQIATGYAKNCVSFNNYINYNLQYKFIEWKDNWNWGGKQEGEYMHVNFKTPNNVNTAEKLFYSIRDQIIKAANNNFVNDNINFDEAIIKLN